MKQTCVLLLLVLGIAAPAQQLRKKIIVMNGTPTFHKDGIRRPIQVLPNFYSDSVSDVAVLASVDSIDWNLAYPIVYGLSETDSTRYALTVMNNYTLRRYIVARFDTNGLYTRMASYDRDLRQCGIYAEYYHGLRFKLRGHYTYGVRTGKWRYYNEEGNLVKKEKYNHGTLVSSREFSRPRFAFSTGRYRNYEPLPYTIIEDNDTAYAVFASDTIPARHSPVGVSAVFQFMQQDFGAVRDGMPQMLDRPRDYCFLAGSEFHIGVREAFYVTGGVGFGIGTTTGFYGSYTNVNVTTFTFRPSVGASVPVLKRPRSILFVYGSAAWMQTMLESARGFSDSTLTTVVYFEDSRVRQTIATVGVSFDFSRKPNVPNWMGCFSLRAGYSFPLSPATWYSGNRMITGKPEVSYEGLTFGIALTSWKVKRK